MFSSNCVTAYLLVKLRKRQLKIKRYRSIKREAAKFRSRLRREYNINTIPDDEFKAIYRMTKSTFWFILDEVKPHLKSSSWSNRLDAGCKLLIAIQFFASGCYQRSIGRSCSAAVLQPTVSKVLNEVLKIFDEFICPRYIKFPDDDEKEEIKEWFLLKYGIPEVVGVIDGTHIGIYPPTQNQKEHLFVNRKGFHSLNVQLIADHRYMFRNVLSKFPGSTHDSFVWRMSQARDHMKSRYEETNELEWILGDSGYPLEPWLMTPFFRPNHHEEVNYNTKFCRARSLVERAIGLLKSRWRCLCKQRQLHYSPKIAAKIINSCVALHNICILQRDDMLEEFSEERNENFVGGEVLPQGVNLFNIGNQRRNYIIAYLN